MRLDHSLELNEQQVYLCQVPGNDTMVGKSTKLCLVLRPAKVGCRWEDYSLLCIFVNDELLCCRHEAA
jgi:hypothetical protein